MARNLANWIDSYLEFSQSSEAPDQFHFWTGVSAVAGALRRHVWMDMGHFQWTPNFYIVFVAPPGIVSKSTTANIGLNLLREVPGIHFGPDVVTWQSLIQSLSGSAEAFDFEDSIHTMSSVTIVSSEFGTFLNPNDREMVDVLVSLWDGQLGTFNKSTKTQGDDRIVNPWINLIACTTPAWIQGNFPEYMIGGGFTSRTIFVYAEEKRRLVAYPGLTIPAVEQTALKTKLIHDLEHIAVELIGTYDLTPSAYRWGEDWYERLYASSRDLVQNDRFAGYVARKQTHLHKLAMILAAAESDTLTLTVDHLMQAEQHLQESEAQQELVFSKIVAPEARATSIVLDVMRKTIRMAARDLLRTCMSRMGKAGYDEAIEMGLKAGVLTQTVENNTIYYTYHPEKSPAETGPAQAAVTPKEDVG